MTSGGRRPGAGRKRVFAQKSKLQVDLCADDANALELRAKAIGRTLSEYVRAIIDCDLTMLGEKPKVVECNCGRMYSDLRWLEYLGPMGDDVEDLDLYNCLCGSTVAVDKGIDSVA